VKIGFGLGISDYRLRGGGLDPDALAFIVAEETAGATFDANQKDAINNLFLNLKGQGPDNNTVDFWTTNKVRKWWPLVGGASSAANEIDIRLNAGVFNGGWTFNNNGVLGNPIDTYFNSLTAFTGEATGDWGWGMYISDFVGGASGEWFNGYIIYSPSVILSAYRTFNPAAPAPIANSGSYIRSGGMTTILDTFSGARSAVRQGGTVYTVNNNSVINTFVDPDMGDCPLDFFFGSINNAGGGIVSPTANYFKSFYITYGVTSTEMELLQQIDNAFQTALGRNTY
jgi:hypothetical protein